MRRICIGVMGPGESATSEDMKLAEELGKRIATQGWVLISGGRDQGVMNALNKGAKQAGGITVGILPGADNSNLSKFVDISIVTGMGSARNNINVLSSDVVVACGAAGAGALSEIALALKAKKRVILLGQDEVIVAAVQHIGGDLVTVSQSVEDTVQKITTLISGRS